MAGNTKHFEDVFLNEDKWVGMVGKILDLPRSKICFQIFQKIILPYFQCFQMFASISMTLLCEPRRHPRRP